MFNCKKQIAMGHHFIALEPLKIDVQFEHRQRRPNQTCKYKIYSTSNPYPTPQILKSIMDQFHRRAI